MSKVAEELFSRAFDGRKVIIVGVVSEYAKGYIEGYGGTIVKSFKDADTLLAGNYPDNWTKRKRKFGATVNPIDAVDYVCDGLAPFGEDRIFIADNMGLCLC